MAAYLQMGHDSWNLLDDDSLSSFGGIVLSPVNDDQGKVTERLARLGKRVDDLEVVFDPQLYNPASDKGQLPNWSYFPSDFETGMKGDLPWWSTVAGKVIQAASSVKADIVCSPAFHPKQFSDDYYRLIVSIADTTKSIARDSDIETQITAIVPMSGLVVPARASAIASILSSSDCDRIYLMFVDDNPAREQYKDSEALPTAIHLVRLLSEVMRVQVAFCSHDAVLWKFAGAHDITSGKFMNLRRYSPKRWNEDETTGGTQISYWNEGSMLTLLRDADVLMLDRDGYFNNENFSSNPVSTEIIEILRSRSGAPWQAKSWRQYLRWLSNIDAELASPESANSYLELADREWDTFSKKRLKFVDRFNDGTWVRAWLNACSEGSRR
jgi:hypothetical protein